MYRMGSRISILIQKSLFFGTYIEQNILRLRFKMKILMWTQNYSWTEWILFFGPRWTFPQIQFSINKFSKFEYTLKIVILPNIYSRDRVHIQMPDGRCCADFRSKHDWWTKLTIQQYSRVYQCPDRFPNWPADS